MPKWLLKLTGDPRRNATFSLSQPIEFSYQNFTVPACEACNATGAILESSCRPVVEKLLCRDLITADEGAILLDWADKVRIGLWLAGLMLGKNPAGIEPHFHINIRTGEKDRILYLMDTTQQTKALRFHPIDDPIFHHAPQFGFLQINHICFAMLSGLGVVAGTLGLQRMIMEHFVGNFRNVAATMDENSKPGVRRNWPVSTSHATMLAQAVQIAEDEHPVAAESPGDRARLVRSGIFIQSAGGQPELFGNYPLRVLPPAFTTERKMLLCNQRLWLRLRNFVVNSIPSKDPEMRTLKRNLNKLTIGNN